MQDPRKGGFGYGEQVNKFPNDGISYVYTHEMPYANVAYELSNRMWIAFFDFPTPYVQLLFPAIAYDGENFTWSDFYMHARLFPEHSYEAPHETMFFKSTAQKFKMRWFALMYFIDDSIIGTPAYDFITSNYARIMQASMNMTIRVNIDSTIVSNPNMYMRAFEAKKTSGVNHSIVSTSAAIQDKIDTMERFVAALDNPNFKDGALGEWLYKMHSILEVMAIDATLKPDVLIMPSQLRDWIELHQEVVNPLQNEASIERFLRVFTGDDNLTYTNNLALIAKTSKGLSYIAGEPYRDNEGTHHTYLTPYTSGMVHVIDADKYFAAKAIDIPGKCYSKIWELSEDESVKRAIEDAGGLKRLRNLWRKMSDAELLALFDRTPVFKKDEKGEDGDKPDHYTYTVKEGKDPRDALAKHLGKLDDDVLDKIARGLCALANIRPDKWNTAACTMYPLDNDFDTFALCRPNKYSRFVFAFRPRLRFRMWGGVVAIGGWSTGAVVFGREDRYDYQLPQVQRREWHWMFRMGIVQAHAEHVIPHMQLKVESIEWGCNAELHDPPVEANVVARKVGVLVTGEKTSEVSSLPLGCFYYDDKGSKEPAAGDTEAQKETRNPPEVRRTYYLGDYTADKSRTAKQDLNADGDVFLYWAPSDKEFYEKIEKKPDTAFRGKIYDAGGTFEDATDVHNGEDEGDSVWTGPSSVYRWINSGVEIAFEKWLRHLRKDQGGLPDAKKAGRTPRLCTGLMTTEPIGDIALHGNNGAENSLCWNSHTRFYTTEPEKTTTVHYEFPGFGPWSHSGEKLYDVLQTSQPRMRVQADPIDVRLRSY
jgi:hypothetical protein